MKMVFGTFAKFLFCYLRKFGCIITRTKLGIKTIIIAKKTLHTINLIDMKKIFHTNFLTWRNSLLTVLIAALGVAGCEKPEEGEKEPQTIQPAYGVYYASYQKLCDEKNENSDNTSAQMALPIQNVATIDKTNTEK